MLIQQKVDLLINNIIKNKKTPEEIETLLIDKINKLKEAEKFEEKNLIIEGLSKMVFAKDISSRIEKIILENSFKNTQPTLGLKI